MNLSTSDSNPARWAGKALLLGVIFLIFDRALFISISLVENNILIDDSFEQEFADFAADGNYSTLILGTSRTAEGIHPYYFTKYLGQRAFKEAQFGKGPKYNYLFYRFFKKHAGKPEMVIYGMDFFTFGIKSRKRWLFRLGTAGRQQDIHLFNAVSLLASHKSETDDLVNFMIESAAVWLGMAAAEHTIMGIEELQHYRGKKGDGSRLVTEKPPRFKRHAFHPFPGEEGDYFIRLLEECHKDGVTVVLVHIPDHIGTFRTYIARVGYLRLLQNLAEPYANVHVLNYNHLTRFPLENNDYFLDGGYGKANSHLSREGARAFNRKLVQDLRPLYR